MVLDIWHAQLVSHVSGVMSFIQDDLEQSKEQNQQHLMQMQSR